MQISSRNSFKFLLPHLINRLFINVFKGKKSYRSIFFNPHLMKLAVNKHNSNQPPYIFPPFMSLHMLISWKTIFFFFSRQLLKNLYGAKSAYFLHKHPFWVINPADSYLNFSSANCFSSFPERHCHVIGRQSRTDWELQGLCVPMLITMELNTWQIPSLLSAAELDPVKLFPLRGHKERALAPPLR